MPHTLISADGKQISVACIGCALTKGEITSVGGILYETSSFTLAQDFEVPIPGFFIIGSKRHFRSFSEFNDAEKRECTEILIKTRKIMEEALGINQVTIIQEEKSQNSHFHIWLFPWYDWMEQVGEGLESIKKIMDYAKNNLKTEENLLKVKEAAEEIKKVL